MVKHILLVVLSGLFGFLGTVLVLAGFPSLKAGNNLERETSQQIEEQKARIKSFEKGVIDQKKEELHLQASIAGLQTNLSSENSPSSKGNNPADRKNSALTPQELRSLVDQILRNYFKIASQIDFSKPLSAEDSLKLSQALKELGKVCDPPIHCSDFGAPYHLLDVNVQTYENVAKQVGMTLPKEILDNLQNQIERLSLPDFLAESDLERMAVVSRLQQEFFKELAQNEPPDKVAEFYKRLPKHDFHNDMTGVINLLNEEAFTQGTLDYYGAYLQLSDSEKRGMEYLAHTLYQQTKRDYEDYQRLKETVTEKLKFIPYLTFRTQMLQAQTELQQRIISTLGIDPQRALYLRVSTPRPLVDKLIGVDFSDSNF